MKNMIDVQILWSLVAYSGWKLHQSYVKNVFLHGDIKNDEDEVYLEILRDFGLMGGTNKVCRLKKSLYGLKNSFRHDLENS